MSKAIPSRVRVAVMRRAENRCEWCGDPHKALELHHRRFRSRGGRHTTQNLVALCGWGNHTGCHGKAHTTPTIHAEGYAISGHDKRADETVPIRHNVWGWCLLNRDGSISMHDRGDEDDA